GRRYGDHLSGWNQDTHSNVAGDRNAYST
ncbi:AMP-binding enzyme family protein, partial [Vibrio parahaemolyticus EKP-028]